jgi:hypothetical protein
MKKIFVKISISYNYYGSIDEVVYFRHAIDINTFSRWKWYFEYLVAKIKINYPKSKVFFEYGEQNLIFGNEYILKKKKDLLIRKEINLKKIEGDKKLMLFEDEFSTSKKNKLIKEIEDLKNNEFNFYIPNEYINKKHFYK